MKDNVDEARMSFSEFFGEDLPWWAGGSSEMLERANIMIDDVEKHDAEVKVNFDTRDVFIEPRYPNTWKDVAKSAFGSLKSSGLAAFGDSIEDRCENMDTWKECAMDVLGYTKYE